MGIIKSVLKEELHNSIKLKGQYQKALKRYPGGSFIQKEIRGRKYIYLAVRDGKKVKFMYKGKKLSKNDIEELKRSRSMRLKYKQLIRKLNKRIKYLRKVLRGKEDV